MFPQDAVVCLLCPQILEMPLLELWGAGGNGNGACPCNRCLHKPTGGGAYTSKHVQTNAGCTYRMCAPGVYRCLSRECYGCNGCSSFVCGYGLCVCACGGQLGCANTSWTDRSSTSAHCVRPGCNGTSPKWRLCRIYTRW